MIAINNHIIQLEKFGDGTLKCSAIDPNVLNDVGFVCDPQITWAYDDDAELFALCCIAREARELYQGFMTLCLPYIPHARQDRKVSDRLFTLKTFAQILNSLKFDKVYVFDPHSDVSMALIDNVELIEPTFFTMMKSRPKGYDAIMFPDAGASKKYGKDNESKLPVIIGNKHRNEEGRIESYDLLGFPEGVKSVMIIDDICSYGGTFVAAAKALREKGVEKISLVVSHCENNILKGEVFDYIDEVYTSDSICTVEHPKLFVQKLFRNAMEGLYNV